MADASSNANPTNRADYQSSPEFSAARKHARRLFDDFIVAWAASRIAATRIPGFVNESLAFRFADHVLESATAVLMLTEEGMHGPVRRELRHLLEHAVKLTAVDQRLPGKPLVDRLRYLKREIPHSSVKVGDVSFWGLSQQTQLTLKSAVGSEFAALSAYVHPSSEHFDQRVRTDAAGAHLGFETIGQLVAVNELVRRIYDIVLVHTFECIGPEITGDVFVQVLDGRPDWSFHRTTYVAELSRHFDYKMERQTKVG